MRRSSRACQHPATTRQQPTSSPPPLYRGQLPDTGHRSPLHCFTVQPGALVDHCMLVLGSSSLPAVTIYLLLNESSSSRSREEGSHGALAPLTRHRLGYWCTLECLGGGAYHAPQLSREPLVVESRVRRHSKALHKTLSMHLSELKIEVTCEVKVRSKVNIRRLDVLGPGDQDY